MNDTPITDAQDRDASQFQWPVRYDRMLQMAKAHERQAAALRAQIHELCHDKHLEKRLTPVTPAEFCSGCERFQHELFGQSPITEMRTLMQNAARNLHDLATLANNNPELKRLIKEIAQVMLDKSK